MIDVLKEGLWKQFEESIDILKNCIEQFPDENWNTDKKFFYVAYHCLLFLDYYLTVPPKNFSSSLSFSIAASAAEIGEAIDDLIPDRIYSKKELLDYLESSREKSHKLIEGLTEKKLNERWIMEPDEIAAPGTLSYSVFEIILYNMRHAEHHAAQLDMIFKKKL